MSDSTQNKLIRLTSSGIFEKIVNATIRIDVLKSSVLVELGVNADGKTQRGPVDAIAFLIEECPPRIVIVQHTVTEMRYLRQKWMQDPEAENSGKKRSDETNGDILKAAATLAELRKDMPCAHGHLILATNREPDEALQGEASVFAARNGFGTITILSGSSIAHVLDHTPAGQSVRRQWFGQPEDQLSWELLRELGKTTMETGRPGDDPSLRVETETTRMIASVERPITFLTGRSGSGKSVAAHEWLTSALNNQDVACLILRVSTVERALTLDAAIDFELRELHPTLHLRTSALDLCTGGRRLNIVVEDIAESAKPHLIVEKLLRWTAASAGDSLEIEGDSERWRLVCPAQLGHFDALSYERKKRVQQYCLDIVPLSEDEAVQLVLNQAKARGLLLNHLEAGAIAKALGCDPLLIGIHDPRTNPDPSTVIGTYMAGRLENYAPLNPAEQARGEEVIFDLGNKMLARRSFAPLYREIVEWFANDRNFDVIQKLLNYGVLASIDRGSAGNRLRFRHDRVRDWLLSECLRRQFNEAEVDSTTLGEPYYAEVLGAAAARGRNPAGISARLLALNPLAVFCAYSEAQTQRDRSSIAMQLAAWLKTGTNRGHDKLGLRLAAQEILSDVDGEEVPELIKLFPEHVPSSDLALFRNGDIGAGVTLAVDGIGTRYPHRDRLIAHFIDKWPSVLDEQLLAQFRRLDLTDMDKGLILDFAGLIGRPELAPGIGHLWEADPDRRDRLAHYIWAAARCYEGNRSAAVLDAALNPLANPGNFECIEIDELRSGFGLHPPTSAIGHLLRRAQDEKLRQCLADILGDVDDPVAIRFCVAVEAKRMEISGDFAFGIRKRWKQRLNNGSRMSATSRSALHTQWLDATVPRRERFLAFDLWVLSSAPDDWSVLAALGSEPDLADAALRARIGLGDKLALPALIDKLRRDKEIRKWWDTSYHLVGPDVLNEIPAMIELQVAVGGSSPEARDWVNLAADLLTRHPSTLAEEIMVKTWSRAGHFDAYIQAALFIGGTRLCKLVDKELRSSADPTAQFRFVGRYFWGGINSHPGATREEQIRNLLHYRHYIDEEDLRGLRNFCERKGWMTIARQLPHTRNSRSWAEEYLVERFEELAALDVVSPWYFDDLARALDQGLDGAVIVNRLRDWVDATSTLGALRAATDVLREVGTRNDLSILETSKFAQDLSERDLIADATFALRRRTLQ